jgi:predicted lipid-binding transport protein (Tim44 family)
MKRFSIGLAVVALTLGGCSKPADEAAPASPAMEPKAASTPAPAAPVAAAPAPAQPAAAAAPVAEAKPVVSLPEGFSPRFHVHPQMTLTSAETIDAATGQYKVVGELKSSAKEMLDYFVKYFQDNGWEEDAVMEQKGETVVSFKKDGYLEYVVTHEGGIGVIITITTGQG